MAPKTSISSANDEQQQFWTEETGQKWVSHQEKLDLLMTEIKDELMKRCAVRENERVLDVGCGTGETTLFHAESVGAGGKVVGADISETMLSLASRRVSELANIELVHADAQTHSFEKEQFDLLASRFGLMFFSDPVAAFSNLALALRPKGRVVFVAWAAMEDNSLFYASHMAGVAQLGQGTPIPKGTPGPFAFSDTKYVLDILSAAGFAEGAVETVDLRLHLEGTPADAAAFTTTIGPVSRLLNELGGTEKDRDMIAAETEKAFAPFAIEGEMLVPACVHYFSAVKP